MIGVMNSRLLLVPGPPLNVIAYVRGYKWGRCHGEAPMSGHSVTSRCSVKP
jgi:hypothetical protein